MLHNCSLLSFRASEKSVRRAWTKENQKAHREYFGDCIYCSLSIFHRRRTHASFSLIRFRSLRPTAARCGIFKCLHLRNTPSIPPTSRNKKNLTEPRYSSSFANRLARFHCIILLIFARLTCCDLLYLDENMRGNKQALLVINMFPRFMISYGRARCDTVLYIASLKVFLSGLEGRRPVEFVVPPLFRHSHVRKHFPFEKNQRTCQLPMKNGKRIIFT